MSRPPSFQRYQSAILGVLCFIVLPVLAQSAQLTNLSTAQIELRIGQIDSATDQDSAEKAADIDLLRQAISHNSTAADAAQLSRAYDAVMTNPEAYRRSQQSTPLPELSVAAIAAANHDQIRTYIAEHEVRLGALAARRENVEFDLREARSRDSQIELARLRDDWSRIKPPSTNSTDDLSAQHILDLAHRKTLQERISMLEKRELSRPNRLELWQEELDYISVQTKLGARQLDALQTRNANLRLERASERESQIQSLLDRLTAPNELTTQLGQETLEHAAELKNLALDQDKLAAEALATRTERTRLQQRYASLTQQLDLFAFGATPEFGAALRAQRDQMVSTDAVSRRVNELELLITDGRLRQFRLDDMQQRLRLEPQVENADMALAELRRINNELVDKLSIGYANYVQDLSNLAIEDRDYVSDSRNYASLLDQNLLWMPSTSRIGLQHIFSLPGALQWLIDPIKWVAVIQAAMRKLFDQPLPVLLLTLAAALLLQRRPRLKSALREMNGLVGKVNRDGHSLTFKALVITALLAAPGPIAMYALSVAVDTPNVLGKALAKSLSYAAQLYFILGLLRQSVRPDGLGPLHFRWQQNTIDAIRTNLPWFMAFFVPALALNLFIDISATADVREGLGRIAFIVATLVLALFAYKTLSPKRGIFRHPHDELNAIPWHTKYLSFPLLVLLPIAVTCLSIYGYHYTAVQLDAYLLSSIALILAALLIFYLAERGVSINERRLTLERVRAKRAAALVRSEDSEAALLAGEGVPSEIDVEEIDLQTISSQTRELIRVFVGIGLGFALWSLWADLLPAFQPLSNIHLWGGVIAPDGDTVTGDVTLWAMLLALLAAGLTFVAGRNIPSLLEVTVLSRLSLEPGTSYAVTTLARYVIVITGSVITLQLLGAEWSKLQWLIAALSVGLGFGLQEIVANFVSGIVLLFERPIRIGDTVTVGDQFGTVSRIRIRATTMVDWDRREIVIPNKTFITERLVNWTLTDPITRTIIRVGVAYGTDVELTETLLLDIAKAHDGVLSDPPPVAVFMNFGDSSLEFELRVFVRGIRDLIPVKHALNIAIDKCFRENHIAIPFPQRDLHLNTKPIEVQIVPPHTPNVKD